ncbi:MAG: ankyrin repeat domain-containing protein [Bryobacteraceae bacterium]
MWEPLLALALLLNPYFVTQPRQADHALLGRPEQTAGTSAPKTAAAPDGVSALALHSAVRAGDVEEVTRLLDAGADPNALDPLGGTPLLTACWSGHASIVSLLLSRGANVNAVHREAGATALEYAVLKGRPDIVELLLAAGATVGKRYRNGQTVLHLAAARVSVPVLNELISANAELTATDEFGDTPLDEAVLHGRTEAVRSLLDHGASVHYVHSADGRGALHEACVKGYSEIVELLIARGADTALRDRSGQSPLDLALAYKNSGVVALLLRLGNTISASQAAGEQAMESAALKGQVDIAQALLNGGFDINRPTATGSTYLHDAALRNQKKIAQLFLKRGASVSALNPIGGTPLHDAALGGSVDVINELLDHGANIDAQDHDSGATPLMLAVSMDRLLAARVLLTRGASLKITDHGGNTALDRALKVDDPDLVKLLRHPSLSGS